MNAWRRQGGVECHIQSLLVCFGPFHFKVLGVLRYVVQAPPDPRCIGCCKCHQFSFPQETEPALLNIKCIQIVKYIQQLQTKPKIRWVVWRKWATLYLQFRGMSNLRNAPEQTPVQNRQCELSRASTVATSWDNHPRRTSAILEYKSKNSMWRMVWMWLESSTTWMVIESDHQPHKWSMVGAWWSMVAANDHKSGCWSYSKGRWESLVGGNLVKHEYSRPENISAKTNKIYDVTNEIVTSGFLALHLSETANEVPRHNAI